MTEDLQEIFLSPLLTIEDTESCKDILKNLCRRGTIVEKYSKNVKLRVVSHNEIGRIANVNCVIVTPLCLTQMRSIHQNPLLFEIGNYANLFLFKRNIALINMSQPEQKRLSQLIKMMGGEVVFFMDKKVNVIVTGSNNEMIDPNFKPSKKATVVRSAWLDALINSDVFLDPMRFRATPVPVPESSVPKKRPMKTLCATIKSIKSENRGDILREREHSHDIRTFLPSRTTEEPSSPEASPSRDFHSQISEIVRRVENSESDSDSDIDFTPTSHKSEIPAICRDIIGFAAERPVSNDVSKVRVEDLLEFTQRTQPSQELQLEVVYGHIEIDEPSDTEDPLLCLF